MRPIVFSIFAAVTIIFLSCMACFGGEFVNEQTPRKAVQVEVTPPEELAPPEPMPPEPEVAPQASFTNEQSDPRIDRLESIVEEIRDDHGEMRRLQEQTQRQLEAFIEAQSMRASKEPPPPESGGAGYQPAPRDRDYEDLQTRVSSLEGRMSTVEEQLKAIVSVRMQDGTVRKSEVEIHSIAGYGEFEVPVGGRVVAINGQPVYRDPATVSTSTVVYQGGTVSAQLVAPRRRLLRLMPMASRYYVDPVSGCTVDRMTGQRVSCPTR